MLTRKQSASSTRFGSDGGEFRTIVVQQALDHSLFVGQI